MYTNTYIHIIQICIHSTSIHIHKCIQTCMHTYAHVLHTYTCIYYGECQNLKMKTAIRIHNFVINFKHTVAKRKAVYGKWKILSQIPSDTVKNDLQRLRTLHQKHKVFLTYHETKMHRRLVRFQVLTAASMMFRTVFWDDGGSTHLWNVGRQSFYTAV
jgi:hypothetical protein